MINLKENLSAIESSSFKIHTHQDMQRIYVPDYRDVVTRVVNELNFLGPDDSLIFFDKLKPHGNSSAQYLIDQSINGGKNRLLVSHIDKRKETSIHYHKGKEGESYIYDPELDPNAEAPMLEEYYSLIGEIYISSKRISEIGNGKEPYFQKVSEKGLLVQPGIVHQAKTLDSPALTLIRMLNTGYYNPQDHHIHLSSF